MKKFILPIALLASPLAAQQFEDVANLDAQVAAVADAAQPIDRRLKLARCPEAVLIDPPALGAVAVRCKSLGWRIRVPLVQAAKDTAPETVIHRGDAIDLISSGDGFEVSTNAIAMEDGGIGKSIRVKSPTSATFVVARVIAVGTAQIAR